MSCGARVSRAGRGPMELSGSLPSASAIAIPGSNSGKRDLASAISRLRLRDTRVSNTTSRCEVSDPGFHRRAASVGTGVRV